MADNSNEIIDNSAPDPVDAIFNHANENENVTDEAQTGENMTEESELQKWQQEVASWKDKYVRLVAEFDNYKKRSFKEKMETIQTAGKDVMMSLLDVIDDSERAEKQMATATDIDALKEGMQLVFNKLKNTLHQKGLKSFDSIGEAFDVEKHEAVTEIPAPSKKMEGKVIDELQKGYLLNDKLIRHAKLVIGKMKDA
ncbi:MAG: nucleotide exchange factor GrpE [Chitinophagaceae bacterium]|nr:nucleotide exchange factor GrpE [Chitinophagaceae bacterium]